MGDLFFGNQGEVGAAAALLPPVSVGLGKRKGFGFVGKVVVLMASAISGTSETFATSVAFVAFVAFVASEPSAAFSTGFGQDCRSGFQGELRLNIISAQTLGFDLLDSSGDNSRNC